MTTIRVAGAQVNLRVGDLAHHLAVLGVPDEHGRRAAGVGGAAGELGDAQGQGGLSAGLEQLLALGAAGFFVCATSGANRSGMVRRRRIGRRAFLRWRAEHIVFRVLKIGDLEIGLPAVQAALSGYSDLAMRRVARAMSAPSMTRFMETAPSGKIGTNCRAEGGAAHAATRCESQCPSFPASPDRA